MQLCICLFIPIGMIPLSENGNLPSILSTILAEAFETLRDGIYELGELKRNDRLIAISDEDILEASKHMKTIMEIMEKYRKE